MSIQDLNKERRKLAHEQGFCFVIGLQCRYDEFSEGHLRCCVEVREQGPRKCVGKWRIVLCIWDMDCSSYTLRLFACC